jgi:hypothetical protein
VRRALAAGAVAAAIAVAYNVGRSVGARRFMLAWMEAEAAAVRARLDGVRAQPAAG